jgi:predicted nucleic acid-binding Zn ribbon protein
MPTYEYVCEKCGHEFEAVKKKISAGGGLLFKGSGFYSTDYRSEGYKQAAKKDTAAPAPAGGETKPAKFAAKPAPAKAESKTAK